VIVLVQMVFFSKTYSLAERVALLVICTGVAISSATDVEFNFPGFCVAIIAVLVTAMYQIWVGHFQKSLDANAMQLLYYQAPLSSLFLLFVTASFDGITEILSFEFQTEHWALIALTSAAAFLVNLSIFLLIGKTSPITYNAVGHFKLCVVILGGFVLFGTEVTYPNLGGIIITVSGLIYYTHVKLQATAQAAIEQAQKDDAGTDKPVSSVYSSDSGHIAASRLEKQLENVKLDKE